MDYKNKLKLDNEFFEAEKIKLAEKIAEEKDMKFIYALEYAEDQLIITAEE